MAMRRRILIVLVLMLLAAALSGLLLMQHHGEGLAAVDMLCGTGAGSGCEEVNRSAYAEVRGVPLAALGLSFYLTLGLLLGVACIAEAELPDAAAALAFAALALGLAVDVVLLGLQAFVLHAYCKLCLATYALNVAGLVALAPARRSLGALTTTAARPAGRLAAAAWIVGSMALVAAVGASEVALDAREALRQATLLGTPAGAAAPAGQAEARRLQEILDDPDKLQRYLNDKAARDFEGQAVQDVDLTGAPAKGPASAPVRVVEYSDFLCPWCRSLAGALSNFLPQSGNRVSVHFKHYPLDQTCNPTVSSTVHAGACWLALGGICADEQDRFWPYHDAAYAATHLKNPGREDVLKLAAAAGLNAGALEACLSSPRPKERLAADIQEAKRVGVAATPTVLINGRKLSRLNDFAIAFDRESQRLKLPPLPPPRQAQGH